MAKFDLLTSSTTIKTIDAVLNKIDDKLRDETVKNDANQVAAFKQLRQKYDDRKIMIISIYQRSVKKNITLQGIEKSTLSLDLLKKYGLKGKVTRAQTFNAIGSALNNKKLKTGITGSLIAGSALRVLNQTNAFGAEGWFTSKVAPKMLEGLKTLTGIGVNPASTFFGAAAIGAGVLLAVGYGMKKWQEKERARVTAQNEVEEAVVDAEKEVRGLVSTDFKNFANSDKINEIAKELAEDPQLKSRVAALLKSQAPAVTQEMKTNIAAALSLAEDIKLENKQQEAKHRLHTAIYSVDKEKVNAYVGAALAFEEVQDAQKLVGERNKQQKIITDKENDIQNLKNDIRDLESTEKTLTEEKNVLTGELKQLREDRITLTEQGIDLIKKRIALKKEIKELEQQLDAPETETGQTIDTEQEIDKKIAAETKAANDDIKTLNGDITKLTAEITEYPEGTEPPEGIVNLPREISGLESEIETLNAARRTRIRDEIYKSIEAKNTNNSNKSNNQKQTDGFKIRINKNTLSDNHKEKVLGIIDEALIQIDTNPDFDLGAYLNVAVKQSDFLKNGRQVSGITTDSIKKHITSIIEAYKVKKESAHYPDIEQQIADKNEAIAAKKKAIADRKKEIAAKKEAITAREKLRDENISILKNDASESHKSTGFQKTGALIDEGEDLHRQIAAKREELKGIEIQITEKRGQIRDKSGQIRDKSEHMRKIQRDISDAQLSISRKQEEITKIGNSTEYTSALDSKKTLDTQIEPRLQSYNQAHPDAQIADVDGFIAEFDNRKNSVQQTQSAIIGEFSNNPGVREFLKRATVQHEQSAARREGEKAGLSPEEIANTVNKALGDMVQAEKLKQQAKTAQHGE